MLFSQPLDRRRLLAFDVRLLAIVPLCLLCHNGRTLAMEDDGNVGTVIISTAAHVVCSNETVSSFAITAMGVNVTDRPDVVWLIQYTSPNDVKEPAVDIYNFSSEALYHTHVWSCPSQLGDWNVSVQICFVPSNPSIVPCLDPSDRLAANTTIVSVQVGQESAVVPEKTVTGCRADATSSVDIRVRLLSPNSTAKRLLRYHFTFKHAVGVGTAGSSRDEMPFHPIANPNGELVTNATSVVFHKEWDCANGRDTGFWDVIVAVHDNSTGVLLAYNSSRVHITKYSIDLTLNGSRLLVFNCSSPVPIQYNYTMLDSPPGQLSLNWIVQGSPNNATAIPDQSIPERSGSILHDWNCPQIFGRYTIIAQVLDEAATIDRLLAQDQVEVEVAALLSLDLSFEQNSHNRVRHHPPMAVGEIFFNASNLAVKGVSSGVDVFFGNVANKVVYDFYPDFGANATALNATQFTHNYTDVDTYSPRVSVRVIGQDATTSGLTLGTGLVEFTDLELIGYVSKLQFTGGPREFHLDADGPVVINYTVSCNLSASTDSASSLLCFNLTLLETNSSMDVPYHHECTRFYDMAHSADFVHSFNVSGLYSIGMNCSNTVSIKTVIMDILVKEAPTPPKVPVVSYTLPISLTLAIGLTGFAVLAFIVYRRHKNRHIEVADFDYMDWGDPRPHKWTLEERILERLGRVCGCLPGPWHWRKSERTARYVRSLAMRTNQADYGATGSFGVSLS